LGHLGYKGVLCPDCSSSFHSSVSYADDEALTRLIQTSFLLLVALPVGLMVVFDSFLLQVISGIVHPDFVLCCIMLHYHSVKGSGIDKKES